MPSKNKIKYSPTAVDDMDEYFRIYLRIIFLPLPQQNTTSKDRACTGYIEPLL